MKKNYINQIPMPICLVNKDGVVEKTNPLIKNVFPYEAISGLNFFTLTGIKMDRLIQANGEDLLIEKNGKFFKIRTNEDVKEGEEIVVFFDEATARETLRSKVENDRAVIIYINIDNYDYLVESSSEDRRRAVPSQIDSVVKKWGNSYDSPVVSIDDDKYVMYTNQGKLKMMFEDNFRVLDEVRAIETETDFPASVSIGVGISAISLMESQELAGAALELAIGRGGDQAVV